MVPLNLSIDESFFQEEVRSGYTVTKERKEVWAIELDLLVKFDQICTSHGLKYCVGAGTLLGAVRHKGFIPWDDDIDVYMVREDYDRLLEYADEFKFPYNLQNSYTEKNLLRTFTRLRNSQTTGVTKIDQYLPIDKGIFIDIFPLDGISPDITADRKQNRVNTYYRTIFGPYNTTRIAYHGRSFTKKVKWLVKKTIAYILVNNQKRVFKKFETNLKRYSVDSTELWGNRTLVFECPKSRRPIKDYTDLIMMPFEFIEVPAPRNYDSMLRQQYGDYMKIPENKKGGLHGELIISTDYAYDDPRRIQNQ